MNIFFYIFVLSLLIIVGCQKEAVGRKVIADTETFTLSLQTPSGTNWYRDSVSKKHEIIAKTNLAAQCKNEIRGDKASLSHNWNDMLAFTTTDQKTHKAKVLDFSSPLFGKKIFINIICKSGKNSIDKTYEFILQNNPA